MSDPIDRLNAALEGRYRIEHEAGESLRERPDREHQLPVDEAVQIANTVAEALDYAHRKGVIYRTRQRGGRVEIMGMSSS